MGMPSAADVAAKWAQNTGAATQAYTNGVNAVTVSPGQLASKAAGRWATAVANAQQKFAQNSAKVSLQEWQAAAAGKGAQRLASGVQAAQGTYEQSMGRVLAHISATVNSLPPRGGLEDNINRMTAFVRGMSKFQG